MVKRSRSESKTFLITGAAGFVGSCIARRLAETNEETHVIVRESSNRWRLNDVLDRVHLHHADLTSADSLRRVVADVQPDVIYHLAAHGGYPHQTNGEAIIHANFLGTWNLLQACADVDYKLLVNTGSSSEYGFKSAPMRETDLLEPNSYYAVTKAAQTHLCQYVARSQQRPIVTLRPFSAYGPYEEPTRLIPTVIRNCFEGRDLTLVPPETGRDFVFIDDVVEAYLRVDRLSQLGGEVFNVASGVQRTVREAVECLLRLTGAKVKCNWGGMPSRMWDSQCWVADVTRARAALGWSATTSLEDGLAKTVEWHRQRQVTSDQ